MVLKKKNSSSSDGSPLLGLIVLILFGLSVVTCQYLDTYIKAKAVKEAGLLDKE